MIRRFAPAIGVGLAACALFAAAPASADPDFLAPPKDASLESLEKSLVFVEITWKGVVEYEDEFGKTGESPELEAKGSCSGSFVAEDGTILTAAHCLNPDFGADALIMEFVYGNLDMSDPTSLFEDPLDDTTITGVHGSFGPDSDPDAEVDVLQMKHVEGAVLDSDPTPAQIIDVMPFDRGDLALIRVPGLNKPAPALPIALKRPTVGAPVKAIGYSGEVTDAMDEARVQRMSVKSGTVSAYQPTTMYGWPALELDVIMTHGMSGGPVINSSGKVIGVVSHGLSEGDNYAADTEDIRRFLLANHVIEKPAVKVNQPTPPTSSNQGTSTPSTDQPQKVDQATGDFNEFGAPSWLSKTLIFWTAITLLAMCMLVITMPIIIRVLKLVRSAIQRSAAFVRPKVQQLRSRKGRHTVSAVKPASNNQPRGETPHYDYE